MIDAGAAGTLVVLALLDSTSFGTLLIPVWLLTAPGTVRIGRILVYLASVALAYLALGVVLLVGARAFLDAHAHTLHSPVFLIGQLLLGIALVAVSQLMDTRRARARAAERAAAGGGRLVRWRSRIMGEDDRRSASTIALAALALTAVAIEAASMLPYLAAIGVITSQGPAGPASIVLLAGYCLVMIAPAACLTIARLVAHDALQRPLTRLDQWLTRHAAATTAWIVGIVGFLLAAHAIFDLGWFTA
ncbi:GAP family protein [Microbacterium sp. TNHR37B]|uniref:GAP family protein n=1 Tax=Microbacterium sp. TNHR37B TaxID=1775956 RepID=UPI0007B258D1|nr:GAP family protein [Microbacterium sp. TNHR37B]KZE90565.1 hypothetical protein AVP41_00084 [Microbacterium sp. TNHR37B]